MKEIYQELTVRDIVPSGNNPRVINVKSDSFMELLGCIKAQGVIVPIHVRDHPSQKGKFELLAGERRLIASAKAELNKIKAICHGKIGDEEAFEITFAENFARADLTPLEQGKAAATLLEKYKGDATAAASKMGKSVRWILQRNAIEKNLSPEWKKAIIEKEHLENWTVSHLQLIAMMPVSIQNEFLEAACDAPTVQQLKEEIANLLRVLSKASWSLDDAKLTKEPACTACPKRSSAQPGLFDDTTDEKKIKKNDRCLDLRCWNEKLSKYLELRAKELRAKHKNLIFAAMPDEKLGYYEKKEIAEKWGGNIAEEWKGSKEGAKDAIPALIIHGSYAGELRWVKFPKATTSAGAPRKIGTDGKAKPIPLKERREKLDKKRWSAVIRILIERLGKVPVTDLVTEDPTLTVMALTLAFGTTYDCGHGNTVSWTEFSKKTDRNNVLAELWKNVRTTICTSLVWCGPITQIPEELIESAKAAAKLADINIKDIFKTVSKEDYPEPKSWASLNENGTAKKAKKSGKKK